MKKLAATLFALAFLATGAQAQTVKDFIAAVTKKWTTPFEPFQLIDNIYYVGTDGIAVYVIKTSQGLILMDTALPQSTGMIKDNITKLGLKVADIKIILNTHAHFDHTGGFAEVKKETGAQLVAGERDKPLLEGGYYPGDEKNEDLAFPAVKVDRTVKEGDKVTLGDTTLTAHATPGHSPGCVWRRGTARGPAAGRSVGRAARRIPSSPTPASSSGAPPSHRGPMWSSPSSFRTVPTRSACCGRMARRR